MSTTFGPLEPEPAPEAMVPVAKHHKKLAPKIGPNTEIKNQSFAKESHSMVTLSLVPHQKSTTSSIDKQKQTQGQPASPQFVFINTTTDVQYSGRGSRSVARSHVMRNFHRKKGKSKLQQANTYGPSASQSLLATAQVQGPLNPNRSLSRLTEVGDAELHRIDENTTHYLTHSENEGGADNNPALWQCVPPRRRRDEGPHELPMNNLWALPVDAHATELIYHCKPCPLHICYSHCFVHSSIHYLILSVP
jgi:hypothetical protein